MIKNEAICCYACSEIITEQNESKEHILPNAIGGRLKSNRLLCITCNNSFGSKHESNFVDQLRLFSGRLPIKRERGENRKFQTVDKKTGLPVVVDEQGKVSLAHVVMVQKPDLKTGGQIQFMAPDEASAQKVIENYRKKFPHAKIEVIASPPPPPSSGSYIEISGGIGGVSFFKTAFKCLLNLYVHEGGDRNQIKAAAEELFLQDTAEPKVWFFSDSQPRKQSMNPPHILAVFGRPEESLLFGYAEFFGGISLIGVLNEQYTGPSVYFTHSVDPVAGVIQKCDVSIDMKREQIIGIVTERVFDSSRASAQLGAIESAIKNNHYFSNLIDSAMKKTLLRPENKGKIITPEMINELVHELVGSLEPNISAASKKRHEEAQKEFEEELSRKKSEKKKP